MSNYREEVKEAIKQYLEDHEQYINLAELDKAEDLFDAVYDDMFVSDEVTGNASGSYTFNSYEAKQNVMADMDTVREALAEFCVSAEEVGDRFLNEDWEYLDVTARCYILGECLSEYIEENEEDIEEAIKAAKEEAEA